MDIKFFNPGNYKNMVRIAKISNSLDKHMKKRCAYCDMDMGTGDNVPVVDFVEHLASEHSDKISPDEVEKYHNLIKKITK